LYRAYFPYLGEDASAPAIEGIRPPCSRARRNSSLGHRRRSSESRSGVEPAIELLVAAAREKGAQAVVHGQRIIKSNEVEAFLKDALVRAKTILRVASQ
jgi:hypothetical protein